MNREDDTVSEIVKMALGDDTNWDLVRKRMEDHIEMRRREVRIEGDHVSAEHAIDSLVDEGAWAEIEKLRQYCDEMLTKRGLK